MNVNAADFFTVNENATRGHSLKLYVKWHRVDCSKNFFSNRVWKTWNELPETVVSATTINAFKRKLKEVSLSKFLVGPGAPRQ